MLREYKPPPIRRIRISDFGLPDLKRDPDRHQNCITWSLSHALPLQKISSKSIHKFASNPTDRGNLVMICRMIINNVALIALFNIEIFSGLQTKIFRMQWHSLEWLISLTSSFMKIVQMDSLKGQCWLFLFAKYSNYWVLLSLKIV